MFLFKHGGKNGEVSTGATGGNHFPLRMARDSHQWLRLHSCNSPDLPDVDGRKIFCAQVHSISAHRQRDVGSGIDQQSSFVAAGTNRPNCLPGQAFKFAPAKVVFAKLDEIHTAVGGQPNPLQQLSPALILVAGKLSAIGDVVDEQAGWWSVASRPGASSDNRPMATITDSSSRSPAPLPRHSAGVRRPDDISSVRPAGTQSPPRVSRRS